jgi:predicted ATPase
MGAIDHVVGDVAARGSVDVVAPRFIGTHTCAGDVAVAACPDTAADHHRGHRRHRSVAETIDWSYRLLPEDVAAFFERLGVFSGPFTADMAHAVAASATADGASTDDRLDALIDASLLVADVGADITWYRQLVTVRAFALQRLEEREGTQVALDRFASHVLARVERIMRAGARAGIHEF